MNKFASHLFFGLFVLFPYLAAGQSGGGISCTGFAIQPVKGIAIPTKVPVRSSDALAILQKAITALGAPNPLSSTFAYRSQSVRKDPNGKTLYQESVTRTAGSELHDFVKEGAHSSRKITPNGIELLPGDQPVKLMAPFHALAPISPEFPLTAMAKIYSDAGFEVQTAQREEDDPNYDVIVTSCASFPSIKAATRQIWFFDKSTGLPAKVKFRELSATRISLSLEGSYVFSSYQNSNGISYPSHIDQDRQNARAATIDVSGMQISLTGFGVAVAQ